MRARNALVLAIASLVPAAVASAQQPAKPVSPSTRSSTTAAQAPAAAKKAAKTSAAAALAVNSDSAKQIVVSNATGATVTSTKLHRNNGKAYYAVSYRAKGDTKTMHATVDANTGVFATVAAPAAHAKSSAKTPS